MRSLRLDPHLDDLVRRAAALRGESVSEFLRRAATARADETLAAHGSGPFADVAGAVHGGGGNARRSGSAFVAVLAENRRKR